MIIFIDGGTWVGGNSFLNLVGFGFLEFWSIKNQPLKFSD